MKARSTNVCGHVPMSSDSSPEKKFGDPKSAPQPARRKRGSAEPWQIDNMAEQGPRGHSNHAGDKPRRKPPNEALQQTRGTVRTVALLRRVFMDNGCRSLFLDVSHPIARPPETARVFAVNVKEPVLEPVCFHFGQHICRAYPIDSRSIRRRTT